MICRRKIRPSNRHKPFFGIPGVSFADRADVSLFLSDVISHMESVGIPITFHLSRRIDTEKQEHVLGYFQRDKGIFVAVCGPLKTWISTLAHEYCHALQHLEKTKADKAYSDEDDQIIYMKKDSVCRKKRKQAFSHVAAYELECERRTVELLRKYKRKGLLKCIDLNEYRKIANSYIASFHFIERTGVQVESLALFLKHKNARELFSEKTLLGLHNPTKHLSKRKSELLSEMVSEIHKGRERKKVI